jgi:hypothetical protein
MNELFGVGVPAISKHLSNIFENDKLDEKVVISILEITMKHGTIASKTQTKERKGSYSIIVLMDGKSRKA